MKHSAFANLTIPLLATGMLAAGLLLVSVAAQGSSIEALIRERQAELAELKQKVQAGRTKIAQLREEGKNIEVILTELERQRSNGERYIKTLDDQGAALERDIAIRRSDLDRKEAGLEAIRTDLGGALVHYYKLGSINAAELIVSSATFGEIFARTHYWGRMVKKLRSSVEVVSEQREAIAADLDQIGARRSEVTSLRSDRERELAALGREAEQRKQDRAVLQRDIARYEEQTRKLEESQARIETLIADAQRGAGTFAGQGLRHIRGQLAWPVRGKIVTRFGTHVHPRYGTRVTQKGIEVVAAHGTPIKAVAAGRVVYAGWLGGYGKTVILEHGQDYFTLYAHASVIDVPQGEIVAEGQRIAQVGDTDSLKGSSLHFEIRKGSEALDPQLWLRR